MRSANRSRLSGTSVAALLLSIASSASAQCQSSFILCQPSGATATAIPSTGADLAPLYNDLLGSVKGQSFKRSELQDSAPDNILFVRDAPSICCNEGTTCLNLQGFNVPMCYDRFTTNFKLVNGASGTIDSGAFTGADGGSANLQDGTFSSGGNTGNMYSGAAASNSPSDSAAIPTPFTGTGVGSAIPLSALGVVQTFLVTIPATTIAATTLPGVTQDGTTVTPQTTPSTVPGTTRAGTTAAGSTQAATTIEAHTSLITTTVAAAAAAATSASSSAGAIGRGADAAAGAGLAGVLAAAMLL